MRMFWTIFFLGSMLVTGIDVLGQRLTPLGTESQPAAGDPLGNPPPDK